MREIETVLLLLGLVAILTIISRRISAPNPILMTIGGLLLGLVPGFPQVRLPPDVAFLVFLPPILFSAAYLTSRREFVANARPIALLAIGLVLLTTLVVALVVHTLVPDMGWGAAFALGAIVSPPDAVSATAIARRLGLPRRVVAILEGESLVNDATALVALRLAVVVVVTDTFSPIDAAGSLVLVSVGGIAIGLAFGALVVLVERLLTDPPVEVLVSLLAPFGAWIAAESLNVSGVLAVVVAGLVLGREAPRVMSSSTRVLFSGVGVMIVFVLNGLVFMLIGLQLPTILDALTSRWQGGELFVLAAAVSLTVILARLAWVFTATYVPRLLSPSLARRERDDDWRVILIIGWAGMRGVVSLAAALALPLTVEGEGPFPARDLLLFLTFVVIIVTLVGQGLTLPLLIRRLGIGDEGTLEHEEIHAREATIAAALDQLEGLRRSWPDHIPLIEQMKARFEHATEHLEHDHEAGEAVVPDQEMIEHAAIRQAVIDAQRVALIDLRDRGVIHDEALRRVERDLDLEELRGEG
ncbi:MAG TPA: Na+/H+ antiporter [Candidatus Limnocylindria bacterium]